MSNQTTVTDAIATSVQHDYIVYLDSAPGLHETLLVYADTCHEAGDDVTEYWGEDDDGNEWRIHVQQGA